MSNPVYSLVSETLARVVSERAADQMVRAALRDEKLSPQNVSAQDMQRVIAGPLQARLGMLMPAARARAELMALAARLQALYPKAPTLIEEPRVTIGAPAQPAPPAQNAQEQNSTETLAGTFDGDSLFGADDFEFDDPKEATRFQLPERLYDLRAPSGQDSLLAELARFEGVQGVVLCDEGGRVLRSRVARGADALGAVMATAAGQLRARPWRILCADLGSQVVCVRPMGRHFVALLTGSNTNLGRLMAELSVIKEAA